MLLLCENGYSEAVNTFHWNPHITSDFSFTFSCMEKLAENFIVKDGIPEIPGFFLFRIKQRLIITVITNLFLYAQWIQEENM